MHTSRPGFCYRLGCLVLLALSCLSACDRNHAVKDLESYVASLKETPAAKPFKPNLPLPHPYQAAGLRSPFELTQGVSHAGATNPLQAYPITMLRFTGTVSGTNGTQAYVLTPDNRVYQVIRGDSIGDHDGKVISIEPGQLTIVEVEKEAGKPDTEHRVTLQLKDEH